MKHRLTDLQIRRRRWAEEELKVMAEVDPILRHISRRHKELTDSLPSGGRLTLYQITRILFPVYSAVSRWRRRSEMGSVRSGLTGRHKTIDSRASDYLIVLRGSLRKADPKQCSKWAAALDVADRYRVRSLDLHEFLAEAGGIEGAAHLRAEEWKAKGGAWHSNAPPTWRRAIGLSNRPRPSTPQIEPWRPQVLEE